MSLSYQAALQEPVLGPQQERSAITRWQKKGDKKSLEILVRSHARLVWAQALSWSNNPVHLEDLVAEGIIGLIRAADNFDLKFRVRFSTYAKWWITAGISASIARVKFVIDIPSRVYLDASNDKLQGEKSMQAQKAIKGSVSLDAQPLETENPAIKMLQSKELTPEEMVLSKSSSNALATTLYRALETLEPTEQTIIKRMKLKPDPDCTRQVANDLNISPAKLRQIESRAVRRLRQALPKYGFHLEMLTESAL